MPWDSFRKKRLVNSSPAPKRKDRTTGQQQVDQNHRGNENTPSSSTSSTETMTNHKDSKNYRQPPHSARSESNVVDSPRNTALSQAIYQKIKSVDQEPSTLSTANIEGLSARVQEKYEFTQPASDGALRTFICQTIELIKRPGQSLGLYLREGNGLDRQDGVFVSRLAEGFDLQKSGVLSTGDEILSVNNVNVTHTSIDEVVIMISIPRRLLLRTRTVKGLGIVNAVGTADLDGTSTDSIAINKPVAVLKQMPREESRESCLTDDGTPLISSQLIATAQTPLGVRARQQESTVNREQEVTPSLTSTETSSSLSQPQWSTRTTTTAVGGFTTLSRHPRMMPQRSLSDRWSYNRQLAMHVPRLLDSEGRPLNDAPVHQMDVQRNGTGEDFHYINHTDQGSFSARVPSSTNGPGCLPVTHSSPHPYRAHFQTLGRTATFTSNGDASLASWNQGSVPGSTPQRSFSGYGVLNAFPRSALRPAPATFRTTSATVIDSSSAILSSNKANSLPRRQPTRTIKWRNDLSTTETTTSSTVDPTTAALYYSSDVSDSDGTVSAPEFPLSPPMRGLPQPVYPLPRPATGKTVDEIFSRAEYQAWAQSSTTQNGHCSRAITGQRHDRANGRFVQQGFVTQTNTNMPFDFSSDTQWNHAASHDDDSSSSSVTFGNRPIPPPRTTRLVKTRSSSLPPKAVLNHAISKMGNGGIVNGSNEQRHKIGDGSGTRYAIDVSPLPHRRQPLALAAVNPAGGYLADGLVNNLAALSSVSGNYEIAALSGILTVRIIDGRGLHSRDAEELYCVLEVDGEHRARTEVRDWRSGFHWDETFEIDVWDCRQTDFYIYSWHSQYRHRLRHHAPLQLVDVLLNMTKFDLSGDGLLHFQQSVGHNFTLNMDPGGQLFVQISFRPMINANRRTLANRRDAYWGAPLQTLIERERRSMNDLEVPIVLKRLIQEIERRGVDTGGLYVLSGSQEKKQLLKNLLENDPITADVSADTVPDLSILASVLKDFLRELPEPLIPPSTYQKLLDTWKLCVANDKESNTKLIMGCIDFLPKANKCTLTVLMDHFKHVTAQCPHNGLSTTKCGVIFGPLIFCTSQTYPLSFSTGTNGATFGTLKSRVNFMDHRLAARLLEFMLELWPSRKAHNNALENKVDHLTNNGNKSTGEAIKTLQESNC